MTHRHLLLLGTIALTLSGCWTTRIWTVAPTTEYVAPVKTVYTTQVTTPAPKQTTVTTVAVTSYNNDWSFYLDLRAVAAAFAEARNAQEFEFILNSSRYMINNLDLNRDGYIDYLRVLETWQGSYHVFLLQACLAPAVFQDVATLVAERRASTLYVEVIGDPYLYGTNYIVRPAFVTRPPMWDTFGRPAYAAWMSPYSYGTWPNYYNQPQPVYLSHYQAYVTTYMTNHHYCHVCEYPSSVYYSGYSSMTQPNTRQDYRVAHPNESFEYRVTRPMASSDPGTQVRNAAQLRTATQPETTTTTTRTSDTSTRSTTPTQTSSSRTTQTTGSHTAATQPTATTRTTVDTRVNKSGTTRTTIKSTNAEGKTTTVKRSSSSASTRSSQSTSPHSTQGTMSSRSSQGTTTTRTASGTSQSSRRAQ